jgi:predicted TIM-barrel fold metal-dependent hydrolase
VEPTVAGMVRPAQVRATAPQEPKKRRGLGLDYHWATYARTFGLIPVDRILLGIIFACARSGRHFMRRATLAEKAGVTVRTVKRRVAHWRKAIYDSEPMMVDEQVDAWRWEMRFPGLHCLADACFAAAAGPSCHPPGDHDVTPPVTTMSPPPSGINESKEVLNTDFEDRGSEKRIREEIDRSALPTAPDKSPDPPPVPIEAPAQGPGDRVELFRKVMADVDARRILSETGAVDADVRDLVRDAIRTGRDAEGVIDALKAASANRARNAVAYARTCVQKPQLRMVVGLDAATRERQVREAEQRAREEAKHKQQLAEREQVESALESPAYAAALAIADRLGVRAAVTAGLSPASLPVPDALEQLLGEVERDAGGGPSFIRAGAFFDALTRHCAAPTATQAAAHG